MVVGPWLEADSFLLLRFMNGIFSHVWVLQQSSDLKYTSKSTSSNSLSTHYIEGAEEQTPVKSKKTREGFLKIPINVNHDITE